MITRSVEGLALAPMASPSVYRVIGTPLFIVAQPSPFRGWLVFYEHADGLRAPCHRTPFRSLAAAARQARIGISNPISN